MVDWIWLLACAVSAFIGFAAGYGHGLHHGATAAHEEHAREVWHG
jgi:hypothetical protein